MSLFTDCDVGNDGQPKTATTPTSVPSTSKLALLKKLKITNKFGIDMEEEWTPSQRRRIENMKQSKIHDFMGKKKKNDSESKDDIDSTQHSEQTKNDEAMSSDPPESSLCLTKWVAGGAQPKEKFPPPVPESFIDKKTPVWKSTSSIRKIIFQQTTRSFNLHKLRLCN